MKILEIACFNFESAIIANDNGADRIEFCKDYSVGGLTPNRNEISKIKEFVSIPIFVMIRNRSGNFFFTDSEINKMKDEILFCKENKIDGVVFGLLNNNFAIDYENTKMLTELARPMKVTFHRAFDLTETPFHEIEKLIELGVDRILTSGLSENAIIGKSILKKMVDEYGKYIKIVVGGGVRSENLKELILSTSASEFHSSAILENSNLPNTEEIKKMKSILNEK